jgi:AcrR family transcriptional regulator
MPKITQQKKDAVRMDILNTARSIFIEKGYDATSMKDIVTSSGRSFGGVYLYYSNKEDVFLELIHRQYEDMASDLVSEKQMSGWSAFVQFMCEQERRVREVDRGLAPCLYEYFIVGRREESRRKLIEERYQGVYGSFYALIHDGVERGEFHPSQQVETFVHWLISFMDGLYLESIINGVERIAVDKQFEFLMTVCRSILMPIEAEEKK